MTHTISQSLLPEFDQEMANTRKVLARVPEGKGDFRPHAKSYTLARLAGHVAEMPLWAVMTLNHDELDLRPGGVAPFQAYTFTTQAEALAMFDENTAKARSTLEATGDEAMMRKWTLKDNGRDIFALPRVAVLRSFVMNHMIHHRAQLGVYLRLNDVAVPGIYGPSADEQ
jgi:uncharacterized damage-inducible protein DinB